MAGTASFDEAARAGLAAAFAAGAPTDLQAYRRQHRASTEHRAAFWREQAERLRWRRASQSPLREDLAAGQVAWFEDGELNAWDSVVAPRLAAGRGADLALWCYGAGGEVQTKTYAELGQDVEALAAGLAAMGLNVGDRVALYLRDSVESILFMLACAHQGLTYVPLPVRMPAPQAAACLRDCLARVLLVSAAAGAEGGYAQRRDLLLEELSDLGDPPGLEVVACRGALPAARSYADLLEAGRAAGPVAAPGVPAEHPLTLLYAKSLTGIPRGAWFATGGFLTQAAATHALLFAGAAGGRGPHGVLNLLELASTAAQSHGFWGPLLQGDTLLLVEPSLLATPDCLRRAVLESRPLSLLASPSQLAAWSEALEATPLGAERFALVACCGEVLGPRLIDRAARCLTKGPESVINLWLQTESGAALIGTLPASQLNRSGALGLPLWGIEPVVLNDLGKPCRSNESGQLLFSGSWPALARGILGQQERYRDLHFRRFPGHFQSNDGVRSDAEGFFWFMGRLDDVVKVAGQSVATSEVEAALAGHPQVAEAAVLGIQQDAGALLFAFVVSPELGARSMASDEAVRLAAELRDYLARRIGEVAVPARFVFAAELPRTRTGKVVRRVLRRIASGDFGPEDDVGHVANPGCLDELILETT